jgi:serine/threonine protein kinase
MTTTYRPTPRSHSSNDPVPDSLDSGRYAILHQLGQGGMGRTYLATDNRLPSNPICVVKQLCPRSNDPESRDIAHQMFIKEAGGLQKLGKLSPKIPRLLDFFNEAGEMYIVQEHIDGYPLSKELTPGHRWNSAKVQKFLQEILTILTVVHQNGIIHRDVKPDNIMRASDGSIHLIDFGALKEIYRHTDRKPVNPQTISIGTEGYMSIEQSQGNPQLSSDLYSLGIIAIQALTGLSPDQFHKDRYEVSWRDKVQVNPALADFIDTLTRAYYGDRFQDAQTAAIALETLMASDNGMVIDRMTHATHVVAPAKIVHNQPMHSQSPSFTSIKIHPAVYGLGAIVVLGLGYFAFNQYQQKKQHTQLQMEIEAIDQAFKTEDFDKCIELSKGFSSPYPEHKKQADNLLTQCNKAKDNAMAKQQIISAKSMIREGKYREANERLKLIVSSPSLFQQEAQELLKEMPKQILEYLKTAYDSIASKSEFKDKMELFNLIPAGAKEYAEAQRLKAEWIKSEGFNEEHQKKANEAKNEQDYKTMRTEALEITKTNSRIWRSIGNELLNFAETRLKEQTEQSTFEIKNTQPIVPQPQSSPTSMTDSIKEGVKNVLGFFSK